MFVLSMEVDLLIKLFITLNFKIMKKLLSSQLFSPFLF
jgi:hypothetical protein